MDWIKILDNLLVYGPLGVIFYVYIRTNFKRQNSMMESQTVKEKASRDNYEKLLNVVIEANSTQIARLESAIERLSDSLEKSNRFYDMALGDISTSVSSIKESCNINCSQLFTAIYEERGLPKTVFKKEVDQIITNKVLESILDIVTNIDANGFNKEENIIQLKDNIVRIVNKRRNEALEEITNKDIRANDEEDRDDFIQAEEKIYLEFKEAMHERILKNITSETLAGDRNYKRLKGTIKNLIFSYEDDVLKILNNIFR